MTRHCCWLFFVLVFCKAGAVEVGEFDPSTLPLCAQQCISDWQSSGACRVQMSSCLCNRKTFLPKTEECVKERCLLDTELELANSTISDYCAKVSSNTVIVTLTAITPTPTIDTSVASPSVQTGKPTASSISSIRPSDTTQLTATTSAPCRPTAEILRGNCSVPYLATTTVVGGQGPRGSQTIIFAAAGCGSFRPECCPCAENKNTSFIPDTGSVFGEEKLLADCPPDYSFHKKAKICCPRSAVPVSVSWATRSICAITSVSAPVMPTPPPAEATATATASSNSATTTPSIPPLPLARRTRIHARDRPSRTLLLTPRQQPAPPNSIVCINCTIIYAGVYLDGFSLAPDADGHRLSVAQLVAAIVMPILTTLVGFFVWFGRRALRCRDKEMGCVAWETVFALRTRTRTMMMRGVEEGGGDES